ncbi:hypothetical protein [Streptomyces sp. CO7]
METHIPDLLKSTGVPEPHLRALLEGHTLPPDDPDDRVRRRVRYLYESRPDGTDKAADVRKLAAALHSTTTWVKRILAGDAKPSLTAGHDLCRYYDVPSDYLTAAPDEAVHRELQRLVFELEVKVNPNKTLADLGVRHVAGRGGNWDSDAIVAVAAMVADIRNSLGAVEGALARLEERSDQG